ncbi:cell fate (sporulation/competence/biofilm development) regulator YlbF (YheA/YmcA/DUF963 family) [Melghirimyces profundicolus]|uniref:Cell fate (Sporulation/competence/biofilm development) regulator YlbF (YheA/YmcA/DUF963 family) n=1 Tax=Melghirimyces profundicolus TaxID=1242148 RepID=A0A2T6C4P0_9BACL|nr:YlbF family regulator [Melghirimyces profundicolus]PTX63265.1 cell fate (sporulation/competence/biofilm development) regulator YlbF (YheA/YmcA/DUF963 family) [Melghirimyces profundicolus]
MSVEHPYDKAYELARALRRSNEMKALAKAWEKISRDPEQRQTMERFRELSMELQTLQMQGRTPGEEKEEELNRLMEEMRSNPELREYLEAERRFGQLMSDINRILGGPVEEIYKN